MRAIESNASELKLPRVVESLVEHFWRHDARRGLVDEAARVDVQDGLRFGKVRERASRVLRADCGGGSGRYHEERGEREEKPDGDGDFHCVNYPFDKTESNASNFNRCGTGDEI